MSRLSQTQIVLIGSLAAATTLSLLYYFVFRKREWATADSNKSELEDIGGTKNRDSKTPSSPEPTARSAADDKTHLVKNTKKDDKEIHARIEELDKRGKVLFKDKQVRSFLTQSNPFPSEKLLIMMIILLLFVVFVCSPVFGSGTCVF